MFLDSVQGALSRLNLQDKGTLLMTQAPDQALVNEELSYCPAITLPKSAGVTPGDSIVPVE
jgi:hypothetical protein